MDSVVQILQVTVRNTRSGRAVYDVACGDGVTRQVWDAAMANALNALAGQNVPIREKVEQKGQYTNRTILAFAQPGQQLPPDTNAQLAPVGGMAQPLTGGPVQAIQPSPQQNRGNGSKWTPETTTRISKLACIEYGASLVGGLLAGAGPEAFDEAVELVLKASKSFYNAARSHEKPEAAVGALDPQAAALAAAQALIDQAAQSGQLTTPAAVAQVVPGVQVGAPVEQPAAEVAAQQDAAAEGVGDIIEWD
jgi:hypothetical protein